MNATSMSPFPVRASLPDMCSFQVVAEQLEIAEPKVQAIPYLWRWTDVRRNLLSAEMHDLTKVHRRAFALCNPGLEGRPFAATTLFASVSVYFPGDKAPAHRHTANASRFAIEGTGGYTTVGGEKLSMERGDLVITPNGEWHDHGNDGTEPIFWIDVLDVPLVERLNAIMTDWSYTEGEPGQEPTRQRIQTPTLPSGYSRNLFGAASVVPRYGWSSRQGRRYTPKFSYGASEVRLAQEALKSLPDDPCDGIVVEYVNPATGQSVTPTISFRSQLIRPGSKLLAQRRTSSAVFCVLEGEGKIVFDDQTFSVRQNDIFVVPGWTWYQIENSDAATDLVLYNVSDSPVHEKLGLLRTQSRTSEGAIADVSRWPEFQ